MKKVEFMTIREMGRKPKDVMKHLSDDGKIIVTDNSKPVAIMIEVGSDNFEDMLFALRQIEMAQAVQELRKSAARSGADTLSEEEIDAEIRTVRAADKEVS